MSRVHSRLTDALAQLFARENDILAHGLAACATQSFETLGAYSWPFVFWDERSLFPHCKCATSLYRLQVLQTRREREGNILVWQHLISLEIRVAVGLGGMVGS